MNLGSPVELMIRYTEQLRSTFDMNSTNCMLTARTTLQNNFIPTAGSFPNSVVDFIGVNNRNISIDGFIDLEDNDVSKINISGLYDIMEYGKTGSKVWFSDGGVMALQHTGTDGSWSSSGMWVYPQSLTLRRNNISTKQTHGKTGYKVTYNLTLIETGSSE